MTRVDTTPLVIFPSRILPPCSWILSGVRVSARFLGVGVVPGKYLQGGSNVQHGLVQEGKKSFVYHP